MRISLPPAAVPAEMPRDARLRIVLSCAEPPSLRQRAPGASRRQDRAGSAGRFEPGSPPEPSPCGGPAPSRASCRALRPCARRAAGLRRRGAPASCAPRSVCYPNATILGAGAGIRGDQPSRRRLKSETIAGFLGLAGSRWHARDSYWRTLRGCSSLPPNGVVPPI